MNFLLTDRKENKTVKHPALSGIGWCSLIVKEVKIMKKLGILLTAVLIVLVGTNIAFALGWGGGTGGTGGTGGSPTYTVIPTLIRDVIRTQTTIAITNYNKYGMAIGSRSVTTSETKTYVDKDINGDGDYVDEGEVNVLDSTVITESTAETQWIGGSLKTSSVSTVSTTFRGDDTTTSSYIDSYAYDADGNLTGTSGSGDYYSIEKTDGAVSGVTVGAITRTFGVKDGQALLLSSITEGSSYGKDVAATVGYSTDADENITGIAIPDGAKANSTFTSGSVIRDSDYSYLGGSWVSMAETQFSESNTLDTDGVTVIGYNHSAQQITYTRDANGIVTGMDQNLLYSDIKSVTGKNTDGTPAISYSYIKPGTSYSITSAFDSEDGWYINSETTETALGQAPAGTFAFSTWGDFKTAYGL